MEKKSPSRFGGKILGMPFPGGETGPGRGHDGRTARYAVMKGIREINDVIDDHVAAVIPGRESSAAKRLTGEGGGESRVARVRDRDDPSIAVPSLRPCLSGRNVPAGGLRGWAAATSNASAARTLNSRPRAIRTACSCTACVRSLPRVILFSSGDRLATRRTWGRDATIRAAAEPPR